MARIFKHVPPLEAGAAMTSVAVSAFLLFVKFAAYYLTGSSAIFSDAMESIVNVIASGVALYSLVVAHRPADLDHPYGHGKVEFLSAGFEGGMILLAAAVILWETIDKLFIHHSVELERLGWGLALAAFATLANGGLGYFLIRTGRKRSSMTLEADGHHLMSDAVTSIMALVALLLVRITGWVYLDPLAAFFMAGYIGWMGIRLLRRSAAGLMDEQDIADVALLRSILDSHVAGKDPAICSYHKLRHRHSGRYHWVDFHIMVPGSLDVRRGHEIASAIEWEIEKALGEGNATAHIEPCVDAGCPACSGTSQQPSHAPAQ